MCLIVDSGSKIRRVFRKVRCWKVLYRENCGTFWAPYYSEYEYCLGKMARLRKASGIRIKPYSTCGGTYWKNCVDIGLHSFVYESDAIEERNRLNSLSGYNGAYVVVTCHIPLFSRFISGMNETYKPCYVSDRLFVEKL